MLRKLHQRSQSNVSTSSSTFSFQKKHSHEKRTSKLWTTVTSKAQTLFSGSNRSSVLSSSGSRVSIKPTATRIKPVTRLATVPEGIRDEDDMEPNSTPAPTPIPVPVNDGKPVEFFPTRIPLSNPEMVLQVDYDSPHGAAHMPRAVGIIIKPMTGNQPLLPVKSATPIKKSKIPTKSITPSKLPTFSSSLRAKSQAKTLKPVVIKPSKLNMVVTLPKTPVVPIPKRKQANSPLKAALTPAPSAPNAVPFSTASPPAIYLSPPDAKPTVRRKALEAPSLKLPEEPDVRKNPSRLASLDTSPLGKPTPVTARKFGAEPGKSSLARKQVPKQQLPLNGKTPSHTRLKIHQATPLLPVKTSKALPVLPPGKRHSLIVPSFILISESPGETLPDPATLPASQETLVEVKKTEPTLTRKVSKKNANGRKKLALKSNMKGSRVPLGEILKLATPAKSKASMDQNASKQPKRGPVRGRVAQIKSPREICTINAAPTGNPAIMKSYASIGKGNLDLAFGDNAVRDTAPIQQNANEIITKRISSTVLDMTLDLSEGSILAEAAPSLLFSSENDPSDSPYLRMFPSPPSFEQIVNLARIPLRQSTPPNSHAQFRRSASYFVRELPSWLSVDCSGINSQDSPTRPSSAYSIRSPSTRFIGPINTSSSDESYIEQGEAVLKLGSLARSRWESEALSKKMRLLEEYSCYGLERGKFSGGVGVVRARVDDAAVVQAIGWQGVGLRQPESCMDLMMMGRNGENLLEVSLDVPDMPDMGSLGVDL